VTIEDPLFDSEALKRRGLRAGSIDEGEISAIILNTAHPEYDHPDFAAWRARGVQAVVDGRNMWRRDAVVEAGLVYIGIGVGDLQV
jgi:hypothetical protein